MDSNLIEIVSTSVILISALIYYFGVLWGKTQVGEYGKVDYYIASVFFITKYMILPFILALFFGETLTNFLKLIIPKQINIIYWIIIIFLQIILLKLIHMNNKSYESKYHLISHKKKQNGYIINKLICLILSFPKLAKLKQKVAQILRKTLVCMKTAFGDHLEQILLFSASSLVVFTSYILYKLNAPYVIIYSSSIVSFLTFTNIALSDGHSKAVYSEAKIFLKDGNIFRGTILRFGNNISLLTNDKKYTFNKDEISYIEEYKLQK